MADGEQVLATAISVSGQVATETMKLLAAAIGKLLAEIVRVNSPEYYRQVELLRQARVAANRESGADKLNELETAKSGYLSPRQFYKAQVLGMEFVAVPISMSKEDVKEFAKIAEKNGILFSAVKHTDYAGKNPVYYISVREKDLSNIDDAVRILKFERKIKNLDIQIAKANNEISKCENENKQLSEYIEAKSTLEKGGLSEREQAALEKRVSELEQKHGVSDVETAQEHIDKNTSIFYKDKEVITMLDRERSKALLERKKAEISLCMIATQEQAFNENGKGSNGNVRNNGAEKGKNDTERNGVQSNFESAVNRNTGSSNERVVYICDTTNPDHYIKAESKQATFEGKSYLRTAYTVFDGGKSVMTCDDERFKGRTYADWANTRNEMKKSLDFSDNVLTFSSLNDLKVYQARCNGAKDVTEQEKGAEADRGTEAVIDSQAEEKIVYRDYDTIIRKIKDSGEKRGYTIEQSAEPVQRTSGKTAEQVFNENKGVDISACQDAAVCQNLSEQLNTYILLSDVEARMTKLELTLLSNPEWSEEHEQATVEMESLKKQYSNLRETEKELSEQRTSLENANVAVEMCEEEERVLEAQENSVDIEMDISDEQAIGENEKNVSPDKSEATESHNMSMNEVEEHFTAKSAEIKAQNQVTIPTAEKTAVRRGR